MKPKIGLITLGVKNLETSKAFYEGLGFSVSDQSNDDVVFFELEGTWLGLFAWDSLAKDADVLAE